MKLGIEFYSYPPSAPMNNIQAEWDNLDTDMADPTEEEYRNK